MGELDTTFSDYVPGEAGIDEISRSPMVAAEYERLLSGATAKIGNLLFSTDTVVFLMQLAADFDLKGNQIRSLSAVIRDVVFGRSYLGDMASAVEQDLLIDSQNARSIANAVVSGLFQPALEDIKKIQLAHFRDRIGKASAPAAKPAQDTSNIINLRKP